MMEGEEEMDGDLLTFEHNADISLMKGQTFYFSSERGVGENGIKDWIGICRFNVLSDTRNSKCHSRNLSKWLE